MVYFVVAGKCDCINYHHAVHVADYLEEHLPNFIVNRIELGCEQWKSWLEEQNKIHGWHHTKSPLIWKEFISGGKPYLIGYLSEFWEYCSDYYGLESRLPREELEALVAEHLQYLRDLEESELGKPKTTRVICISGAANPMMVKLLPELAKLRELDLVEGVEIRLYDRYVDVADNEEFINTLLEDFSTFVYEGPRKTVSLVSTLSTGLIDCDVFIIIDYFRQKTYKNLHDMLQRKMSVMMHYADVINSHAHRNLRIILSHQGPVCFNASVLAAICTRIRLANIVAVTSDIGLGPISIISKKTGIPVANMGGPPVWGFIGMNQFVDVDHIVKYSEICLPYKRAVRCDETSTLPFGTVKSELRYISYLIADPDEILREAQQLKIASYEKLNVLPFNAKVRATVDLLKLWFSKTTGDEIISLGIVSDGTFGLPPGIVFSQPVKLDRRKVWMAHRHFPLSEQTKEKLEQLSRPVVKLMESYNITQTYSGIICYENDE